MFSLPTETNMSTIIVLVSIKYSDKEAIDPFCSGLSKMINLSAHLGLE